MKHRIGSFLAVSTALMLSAAFPQAHETSADSPFCNNGKLAEEFDREFRDSTWAERAEAVLFSRISQAPGLELRDMHVECHETVCRLHFVFPTDEYQLDKGNSLIADTLDVAPGFVRNFARLLVGADGLPSVVYYLKRDGVCQTRPVV